MAYFSVETRTLWKYLAIVPIALLIVVVPTMISLKGCYQGYSEGDRAGVITKFSHKGWVKSWEGTLNVGGASIDSDGNAVPSLWDFSVVDPNMVDEIKKAHASGRRVILKYNQFWVKPKTIDTPYVIVGVSYTQK